MNLRQSILIMLSILSVNSGLFCQTASIYEGTFTRFSCNSNEFSIEENPIEISAINDSVLVIYDFAGIPNSFLQDNTIDSILVQLNHDDNEVGPTEVNPSFNYTVQGACLIYEVISGEIFEDSIAVSFFQINPQGTQEICLVYKRGDYTSMEEWSTNVFPQDLRIYPNPLEDNVLNVDLPQLTENGNLLIRNVQGEILYSREVSNMTYTKDTIISLNLISGFYMIELWENSKLISAQKFIKI